MSQRVCNDFPRYTAYRLLYCKFTHFFCNLFIKVIFSITDRTSTACDYAGSLPVESVYELVDNEL